MHRAEIESCNEQRDELNRGIKKALLIKFNMNAIKKWLKVRDDFNNRFSELGNMTIEYHKNCFD